MPTSGSDLANADLERFLDGTTGPYLSVLLPARSDLPDAAHRLQAHWNQQRQEIQRTLQWPQAQLADIDELVGSISHAAGDSVALIVPTTGTPHIEFLAGGPATGHTITGALPALAPIIDHRQRTIPHLLVDCDKAGADIIVFDGGAVVGTEQVKGDTLHIHRGHPGGWSQRRFQQRAENTWESNISEVADAVEAAAADIGADLIAVAGPTRAKSMLTKELGERAHAEITVALESGNPTGIAEEVVRCCDDVVARRIAQLSEDLRDREAGGTASTNTTAIIDALRDGRVQTLLVNDDWSDTTALGQSLAGIPTDARLIDAAIAATITGGGTVVPVPRLAALNGPLGALLRW